MKNSKVNWDGSKFYNLNGSVCANAGYSIVDDLKKMNIEVETAKTTEQNLLKLQSGRIAFYAAQDITTDYHVKTGKYGDIIKLPTPIVTKDYFLIFSKKFYSENKELAEKLWKRIGEIRDKQTQILIKKYPEK